MIFLAIPVVLFTVFGFIIFMTVRAARKRSAARKQAESWLSTPGVVTICRYDANELDQVGGKAFIRYTYTVNGNSYTGNRASFRVDGYSIVKRFPAGSQVNVFYDPANPSNAVLER